MRLTFLALVLLLVPSALAQVYNGSFENGTLGWTVPSCPGIELGSSADTPGNTGNWSLQVRAEQQGFCYVTYDLYQPLPWLTPGPWTLRYWSKGHGSTQGPPARVMVAYQFQGSAPALTSGWNGGNTTSDWIHQEESFYWDGVTPPLDSLMVLIAGGAADDGPLYSYFDEIEITGFTTGADESKPLQPAFRPNPVTDRMWIALDHAPLWIDAVDAIGRSTPVHGSQYRNATLELDASELPAGPLLLRIGMPDGVRVVRFVKL